MKRLLLFTICIILAGGSVNVLAQCKPLVNISTYTGSTYWQVFWYGDTTINEQWQLVLIKQGLNPDDIKSRIIDTVIANYGEGIGNYYSDTALPLNIKYYCFVRTICDSIDTSAWSTPNLLINLAAAPISNFQAMYVGDGEVSLYWNGTSSFYNIFRYNYQTGTEDSIYQAYGYGTFSYYDFPPNPGWYYYKVVSTSTGDSALSNRVEYSNCAAAFSFEPIQDSSAVILYNQTFNANSFYWDFGDGNVSMTDSFQFTHTYARNGFYNVCLTASDTTIGCSSQLCEKIAVGNNISIVPTPVFTPYADSGLLYTFYNNTQPLDSIDFYWTFGDGQTSSEIQPDHSYTKAGNYNVCLTATDLRTKLTATSCQQVNVGFTGCNLSASFNYVITSVISDTVQFSNFSTGNIAYYYWYFDDGAVSTTINPVHHFDKMGNHLVLLIISDSSWNCSDYAEEYVQVGSLDCKADFEYSVGANDSTVTFSDNSGGNIATYYWSFGDGGFSTDENPVHTYNNQGMYSVSLTIENSDGTCMDNVEKEVQVGNINCSAQFNYVVDVPSLTVYCKNKAIGNATQYYWSFGDGSFSSDTNPVHHFKYPGYYKIGLNTYNSLTWCMDYHETTILVGSESIVCKPDFYYKVDTGSGKVKFKDNSLGTIKSYVWDFGDGIVSTDKDTTSHVYPHGGYYNVCLTVVNNNNSVPNMICKWIEVAPDIKTNCYSDFNFTIDSAKKAVSFLSQSLGNPTNFDWNLGDGNTSTQKDSLIHYYTLANYYLVSLHIKTTAGCESYSYKLINIGQPDGLYAKFGYTANGSTTKAGGYPVDLVGAGIGDNSKLRWTFGDGNTDSTSMTPIHVYTKPGKYKVCLTYSDTVTQEESTECDSVNTCQNDSIKPVAKCKNISITLIGGTKDILPSDVDNNSYDNCGIYDHALDNKHFVSANVGDNLIHLIITDFNNNKDTCTAMVTVLSDIAVNSLTTTSMIISPNPLGSFMNITYQLPVGCTVDIGIYDLLGKRVATINTIKLNAGKQVQSYDASGLSSGMYIIQLRTSTGIISRQEVVKR